MTNWSQELAPKEESQLEQAAGGMLSEMLGLVAHDTLPCPVLAGGAVAGTAVSTATRGNSQQLHYSGSGVVGSESCEACASVKELHGFQMHLREGKPGLMAGGGNVAARLRWPQGPREAPGGHDPDRLAHGHSWV